jgi:hypothetical protein
LLASSSTVISKVKPWRDACLAERQSPRIRRFLLGCDAKPPEKRRTTFRDFVLRQGKRTALRNYWLHIPFSLNGLGQREKGRTRAVD